MSGDILVSHDGGYYLTMGMGLPVPAPFSRRWLLPSLLGADPRRWLWMTRACLALTPAAAWLYFGTWGLAPWPRAFAAALLSALPGVWRVPWRFPVLTDAPAFLLALVAAWAARAGLPWLVLVAPLSCLLAITHERGPVFAALWAWSPWPLVGLAAVRWWRKSPPPDVPWLQHPVRAALNIRRDIGPDGTLYLRPFGAALAGLALPSWQMALTVAVAHAQLLVAVDCVRLTVWCAPVLVVAAAKVIPSAWWALALAATALQKDERV